MARRSSTVRPHVGPRGTCDHCDGTTVVRVGSFLGPPKIKSWRVTEKLVDRIRSDLRLQYRDDGLGRNNKLYVCPSCATIEPRMVLWVELESHSIVGPWCDQCAPRNGAKMAGEDGLTFDPKLYMVTIGGKAGRSVLEYFTGGDAMPEEEGDSAVAEEDEEEVDMF